MTDNYDDIINLPRWNPKNHSRMPMANRAAQFAPFAALTGHDEAIRETARLTDHLHELDAESTKLLNDRINLLILHIHQHPEIEVTYFVNDQRKDGGMYSLHKGAVRRVDEAERLLVFTDGIVVPLSMVTALNGDFFSEFDDAIDTSQSS